MKSTFVAFSLPLLMAFGSVHAAAPDPAKVHDILAKNNCLACHAVDKKVVGPAYKDVAAKYKDDANAPKQLATHIRNGSSGVWGPVPMPPNPGISDEDIQTVVDWLMAGAPE